MSPNTNKGRQLLYFSHYFSLLYFFLFLFIHNFFVFTTKSVIHKNLHNQLSRCCSGMWTKDVHPNTSIETGNNRALGHRISTGPFFPSILYGIRFIKRVAVNTPSECNDFGAFISIIRALITSNMCLFFHSTTPFCSDVYVHEICDSIPFSDKYDKLLGNIFSTIVRLMNLDFPVKLDFYCFMIHLKHILLYLLISWDIPMCI